MRGKLQRIVLGGLVFLSACTHDPQVLKSDLDETLRLEIETVSPTGTMDHFMLPHGHMYNMIPQDPKNPMNHAKVELGKQLFFETGMAVEANQPSGMGTYSCATCHTPEAGFRVGREQGIADGGVGFGLSGDERLMHGDYEVHQLDVQGIRPLSILNVCEVTNTMWAGPFGSEDNNVGTEANWTGLFHVNELGYRGLESQNIEGMELHRLNMTPDLAEAFQYTELFDEAFPDFTGDERYSRLTASLAISAYLRSVTTTEAPFQQWIRGYTDAMSDQAKRGAILFFGEARCTNCHNEANLGGNSFHALGVKDLYEQGGTVGTGPNEERNKGRAFFTQDDDDLYAFRVPQLYNLKDAPVFFHGASKRSLEEVIAYKCEAISENPHVPNERLSPFFKPLELTEQERADLLAFLRDGLFDPDIQRFVPSSVGSGNCFPNNDPVSRAQLGCQ